MARVGANIEPYISSMDQVVSKTSATIDTVEARALRPVSRSRRVQPLLE